MVDTTIPRNGTADLEHEVPSWVFVLAWSFEEPHRIGEVAFLTAFEYLLIGRGDDEVHRFAHFGQHLPGEPLPAASPAGFLAGRGLSRRHLRVRATAVGVEVEIVGKTVTFVNGNAVKDITSLITLQHGDTIYLQGEVVLLCLRRPKTLPGPRAVHAFGGPDENGIVGGGPGACELRDQIAKAAADDHDVLIEGESGTGKELVANAIHRGSKRKKGPFVDRNASSFALSLADSELFGNVANYPNPGMPARKGLVGTADGGTLFLDEIGDCHLDVQARLLRFMDEGRIQAVGESTTRQVDVRVVGATNKDRSAFRPDFRARFKRNVCIRPLRERQEDIPLLIRHWLQKQAHESPEIARRFCRVGANKTLEPRVNGRLVDYLVRQPLPRNMRDIEEFLVKAMDESPGDEIRLPRSISTSNTTPPPEPPEDEEDDGALTVRPPPTKEEFLAVWARERANVSRVAKSFGRGRNVIYKWMREYGIRKDETDP